jgi:hypothetical protein
MGEYSPWRHFLHSFTGFVTRFTRRVSLVEQELLTLPEWGSCHSIFSLMCMFCRSLFVFCTFSFDHCVVCSSLIYGFWLPLWYTGTCFIQKIYALSSSLLQGKHLPFTPSSLRLNIFRLFVILSLTQLYSYTPEIFIFSTATFKYKYRAPLRRIGQKCSAKVAFSIFQSLKRIQSLQV